MNNKKEKMQEEMRKRKRMIKGGRGIMGKVGR